MKFDKAREAADRRLSSDIAAVRDGAQPEALDSFARAYLGLLLDIDDDVAPPDRVRLLANEPLAGAVLEGFVAVVNRGELPGPEAIGRALARGERFASGYVMLAGAERMELEQGADPVADLPRATLAGLLCLHYANTPTHHHAWVDRFLIRQPGAAAETLLGFWGPQLPVAREHLPGLRDVMDGDRHVDVLRRVVLPLLDNWRECSPAVQRVLLQAALRYADRDGLRTTTRRMLELTEQPVKKRVYWLATAFLLDPEAFGSDLAEYCGRVREKTLPLLDFCVAALGERRGQGVVLAPRFLALLLRIVAPTFRRNEPLTGGLDAVSGQVLWLFDQLARDGSDEAVDAVADLRRVRVMRMYADVLDHVARRQAQRGAGTGGAS